MDHYVVTDTDLQAPATVKGNAYFRFRPTTRIDDFQLDLLVKVAFEVLPRLEMPADEPIYPSGPRKLHKRRGQERENKKWAARGQASYARSDGVYGQINCFLYKTPANFIGGHDSQGGGADYLEALTGWKKTTANGLQTFWPTIEKQQVAGTDCDILILCDNQIIGQGLWGWLVYKLMFGTVLNFRIDSFSWRSTTRFVVLVLFTFLCAFGAASRISSQDVFGGTLLDKISQEVNRQFSLGKEFYALPLEEKLKYHNHDDLVRGEYNGYRSSAPTRAHSPPEVVVKLLRLFALLLELPDEDQLVRNHLYDKGEDHLRYMHYAARSAEENEKPVAALQILNSEGNWKWIKPQDATITINTPNNHVALDPIQNSPLLTRLGLTTNAFTELGQHLITEGWVIVRRS
ncbi:hypothetical protein B0T26DRAFT_682022 [Lasiosphaeria miniovina]|uniref:Uncharacterized protein n=1 Tax=Lasiosphaeria miniovina TaxID=1954250 RepID=A0AA39ZQS1_9PEZI|nr:uncharacterized protein B0T26DRAFT_682022 [Lasiosphaeria miniovina]KAK0701927.1 hypothetical protein B0T26DRAFT_682022 [Lasiosphaeria miniovina]